MEILIGFWRILVGSNKLTDNNRTINAVIIITMAFLLPSTIINIVTNLKIPAIINTVLLLLGCVIYWLSRVKQEYKVSFFIYAALSYIALITIFIFNSGIDGPILFLFLLTFNLLVAISPKRLNVLWTILHLSVGIFLMTFQHFYPNYIFDEYENSAARLVDVALTFAIAIIFLSIMTKQLRLRYDKEKTRAKKRAELIEEKSLMIARQNSHLKKIASVQSHEVRGYVATILGLSELINSDNPNDETNQSILDGIKCTAKNLDKTINEINVLTRPDY